MHIDPSTAHNLTKLFATPGGVKRKALLVNYTRCNHYHWEHDEKTGKDVPVEDCNVVWLDKVMGLPHTPTCPKGHVQMDMKDNPIRFETEEDLQLLIKRGIYLDIAAAGKLGTRTPVSRRGPVTPQDLLLPDSTSKQ
jgi:hypothetical protein